MKKFFYKLKVFYEDTDAGGVVYYANYLKFFERARTEMLSELSLSNKILSENFKILIIVKSCNIEYKKPAKLEDNLEVVSWITSYSSTSFKMKQEVIRNGELITECNIHLVTVDEKGRPTKTPLDLQNKLFD
tara:strand:- start:2692 stop:3087 length:396 start_codon:yes stop_codon:yes gene_type:complete